MNNINLLLTNYLIRHIQAACGSLGRLTRTPVASFFTCLVLGVTMALPALLYVTLKNIEAMRGNFQQTTQVTLYLKNTVTEFDARTLAKALQQKPLIAKITVVSPEEGLRELEKNAGFQGVLEELNDNPLPWAIIINPKIANDDTRALDAFTQTLKQLPQVEAVLADMLWVKRFAVFAILVKRAVLSLAILLSAAVLLIVNNVIRAATERGQKEIEIIKLIGGTPAFIRRPFLYTGIFYGLLGGIIACLLVTILLFVIDNPMRHFAGLFDNSFELLGLGIGPTFSLLGAGILLGFLGAFFAVSAKISVSR